MVQPERAGRAVRVTISPHEGWPVCDGGLGFSALKRQIVAASVGREARHASRKLWGNLESFSPDL